MSRLVSKIRTWLSIFMMGGAGMMMLFLFIIVFVNAFGRYVFDSVLIWGEEASVFAMIFGVMFGTGAAYLDDKHVKFSVLLDLFPATIKLWFNRLADLIMLVVGASLIYSGYLFMVRRGKIDSPGLGMEMAYFQSAIILGGVLIMIVALFKIFETWVNRSTSDTESA